MPQKSPFNLFPLLIFPLLTITFLSACSDDGSNYSGDYDNDSFKSGSEDSDFDGDIADTTSEDGDIEIDDVELDKNDSIEEDVKQEEDEDSSENVKGVRPLNKGFGAASGMMSNDDFKLRMTFGPGWFGSGSFASDDRFQLRYDLTLIQK